MERQIIEFERKSIEVVPESIQEWYEAAKEKQGELVKVFDEQVYILVTAGEKNSGGHDLTIRKLEKADQKYQVFYSSKEPTSDELSIASFDYPYDLIIVPIVAVKGAEKDIKDMFEFKIID